METQVLDVAKKAGLIVVVILVLRLLFKKVATPQSRHQEPGVNTGNLSESKNYETYATDLFNAFDGIDWSSTKARAMERINALNDDEFKQVYIIYNRMYADAPETMKTHANAEWIWGDIITDFIARHEALNLP